MNVNTSVPESLAPQPAQVCASVDDQRRELLGRIESLRQAGALPMSHGGDVSASVAQWTNWSNG